MVLQQGVTSAAGVPARGRGSSAAGDRPDLLAEHAGLALGLAELMPGVLALPYLAEAELTRAAGADEALIPAWIEIGRKRAEQSRRRPYT
jgi:hypothetical protein